MSEQVNFVINDFSEHDLSSPDSGYVPRLLTCEFSRSKFLSCCTARHIALTLHEMQHCLEMYSNMQRKKEKASYQSVLSKSSIPKLCELHKKVSFLGSPTALLYHIIVKASLYWRCISQGLKACDGSIYAVMFTQQDPDLLENVPSFFLSLHREVPKFCESFDSFLILNQKQCVFIRAFVLVSHREAWVIDW